MIASTNHFLFMAILAHGAPTGSASAVRWLDVRCSRAQRGHLDRCKSQRCSILLTSQLRLVIENHIQQ
jgi:hypothetical protein